MKKRIDLVKLWIRKAENDLVAAEHLLTVRPHTPYDTICFHAQQCAEKYLKEEPKEEEARLAIRIAIKIKELVLNKLSLGEKDD